MRTRFFLAACDSEAGTPADVGMQLLAPAAAFDDAKQPVNIDLPRSDAWTKAVRNGAASHFTLWTVDFLNLIHAVLSVTRQSGTGIVAGTFCDRQDHRIANMQARAYRYFNGEQQPDATQRWTKEDGLFGALNLPVPSDGPPIRIEGWGNVDGTWRMRALGALKRRKPRLSIAALSVL